MSAGGQGAVARSFEHAETGRLVTMETEQGIAHCQGSPYWKRLDG